MTSSLILEQLHTKTSTTSVIVCELHWSWYA